MPWKDGDMRVRLSIKDREGVIRTVESTHKLLDEFDVPKGHGPTTIKVLGDNYIEVRIED